MKIAHLPITIAPLVLSFGGLILTPITEAATTSHLATDASGNFLAATNGGAVGMTPVYSGVGTVLPNVGFTQAPFASSVFLTTPFISGFSGTSSLSGVSLGEGTFADFTFTLIAADPSMPSSADIDLYANTNNVNNQYQNYIFNNL